MAPSGVRSWVACGLVLGFIALAASGCAESAESRRRAALAAMHQNLPPDITLDGSIVDWPTDAAVLADDHYLYFRFTFPDRLFTLQAAQTPVRVYIDADGSASTGDVRVPTGLGEASGSNLGIDLIIEFSPEETKGLGAAVCLIGYDGTRTKVPSETFDLMFAPTYASAWYEARITRHLNDITGLPQAGLKSVGEVAVVTALLDESNKIIASSEVTRISLPPVERHRPQGTIAIPAHPPGTVRIVSWNVETSGPTKDPTKFRSLLTAIQPDIVLVQEWDAGDTSDMRAWFQTNLRGESGEVPWSVVKAPGTIATGGGVAVVSRYPMRPVLDHPLTCIDAGSTERPIRFTAARLTTPYGDFICGSTHLKSRGSKDSPEDRRRLAEARAINSAMRTKFADSRGSKFVRIITGDMNLVGSRPPLDVLRAMLNADGSDLAVAKPLVLGDKSVTTWADPTTPFTPGRLDYVLYSESNAQVVNAFVVDTRRMSDDTLAACGLSREDSAASDHMPVVVDVRVRP